MNASDTTHRRGFLGRMFGAAAAAGVSIRRRPRWRRRRPAPTLDQRGERHPSVPVRLPPAQERVSAAAHPQLPEYVLDGLQGRAGTRSAPSARSTESGASRAFRSRSTTRCGRSTSSANTRGSRTRRGRLHPQRVPPADEGRSARADAGHSDADHSRVRRSDARRSASRACRRWDQVPDVRERARAAGAWSSRRAEKARGPTSEGAAARIYCPA